MLSNRDLIACLLVFLGYMFKIHKEWIDFIHRYWSIIIIVSFVLLYLGSSFFVIDMKHDSFSYYGVVPIMTIIGVVFCFSLSDFILYINILSIIDKTTTGVLIGFAKEQYLEKIISGHNTVQI